MQDFNELMVRVDSEINNYFKMFRENENELFLSSRMKKIVFNKLNDYERLIFLFRIVHGLKLRQIGNILGLKQTEAQRYCKRIRNRILDEYRNEQ